MPNFKNLLCGLTLSAVSMSSYADAFQIRDETIPFLYESRADIKTPDYKLASIISSDYASARDEFTKHDLMTDIKPVIDKRIIESKAVKEVEVKLNGNLGEYDFEKKQFTTNFSSSSFLPYQNKYAVQFSNAEVLSEFPVQIEKARKLSASLRKSRQAQFTIHGTVESVKEEKLNYSTYKVVMVRVSNISVALRNGTPVVKKEITSG